MNDKKLSEALAQWFKLNGGNPNIWNKTYTGKLLKNELDALGNWKNARRGNPSKGARVKRENQFRRENPDCDEREDY